MKPVKPLRFTVPRVPVFCALLSGGALFLSTGLGGEWWLAWFAPVPVLWLAFSRTNPVIAMFVALAASALGGLNLLPAYYGVTANATLASGIALTAIAFAACTMLARYAGRCLAPIAAPFTFAALWTAWDYIASLSPDGALLSPAYSQAGVPLFIQSVSLFGLWIVTFLLGVSAGFVALTFAERNSLYMLPAAVLFAANLAYGAVHLEHAQGHALAVTLIDSDALSDASAIDRRDLALGAVLAYAAKIQMTARGADLVVLPEKIAVLRPEWRDAAFGYLRSAAYFTGATIVAGFEEHGEDGVHNIAWTVTPDATAPDTQVQSDGGVETGRLDPRGPDTISDAFKPAIALSHDLDFVQAVRGRAVEERPGILAVPAWDFGFDGDYEARKAAMRGVENGFAVARTARDGELVLSDALGRVMARTAARANGFTSVSGTLESGPDAGDTLYDRIGDVFAWFSAVLGFTLVAAGFVCAVLGIVPSRDLRRRRPATRPAREPAWLGPAMASRRAAPPDPVPGQPHLR